MSGWIPLVFFLALIVGLLLFLFIRYLQMRAGLKDQFSGVQHASRKDPPAPDEEIFLPGSRLGSSALPGVTIDRPESPQKTSSKAKRLFRSKEDIRRSYIIDALLERPKF